jgi:porphobilinogen deaminase
MEETKDKLNQFIVGTRASDLAKVQTYEVIDLLTIAAAKHGLNITKESFDVHEIKNSIGDTDQNTKLFNMGGRGVFCKQLEQALLGMFIRLIYRQEMKHCSPFNERSTNNSSSRVGCSSNS